MTFPTPRMTINCKGRLISLEKPLVMGILNVTPDSFYDGGRYLQKDAILKRAGEMISEGATFLDIGGMSSRPGAAIISEAEELRRVESAMQIIMDHFPETLISIDTTRASVARRAIEMGAVMINDISAGKFDPAMYETAANLQVPYVLMHMQGTPADMQKNPQYGDVVLEVLDFFIRETHRLRIAGVKDTILDPGFGFGKNLQHNFQLLNNLHIFSKITDLPVLVGISRKSMVCKPLGIRPDEALNGTTALHVVALEQGAKILRVHDIKEARQVIQLWELTRFPHVK